MTFNSRKQVSAPETAPVASSSLALEDGLSDDGTNERSDQESHGADDEHEIVGGSRASTTVCRLRGLVMALIFLATVGVSLSIYFITSRSEQEEFEQQFNGAAGKILTSFSEIIDSKFSAIQSLSTQCSLYVNNQDSQAWPFVTVQDFQLRAEAARKLSGALFTRIVPIVPVQDRARWEAYSVEEAPKWLTQARDYLVERGIALDDPNGSGGGEDVRRFLQEEQQSNRTTFTTYPSERPIVFQDGYADQIFVFDEAFNMVPDPGVGPYLPLWQESPTFGRELTNWNILNYPYYAPFFEKVLETAEMTIGGMDTAPEGDYTHENLSTSYYSFLLSLANGGRMTPYLGDPFSAIFLPVFDNVESPSRNIVAVIFATFKWAFFLEGLLAQNTPAVVVVLENSCNQTFTYMVQGSTVSFLGPDDLHLTLGSSHEHLVVSGDLVGLQDNDSVSSGLDVKLNLDICAYKIHVYPSQEMEDEYLTPLPLYITFAVVFVFILTACAFLGFNWVVERRQALVMRQAVRSTAIVSSLFPETVRDRLIHGEDTGGCGASRLSGKSKIKSFLDSGDDSAAASANNKPIADLFPECTVFFADIAEFTAWSSTRDPSQVFSLLQAVYQSFDSLTKKRKVFKVETIGDSYVAVSGLPNANPNHAVDMALFANDCLAKFKEETKKLEVVLGPDTGDLGLRIGLNSGPVTAGVLRGERSRFQLFGDTVNTASRMESTSKRDRIQISGSTASLLKKAGYEHWLSPRTDSVVVKGKGVISMWWLDVQSRSSAGRSSMSLDAQDSEMILDTTMGCSSIMENPEGLAKQRRLVQWIAELLLKHVGRIMARQDARKAGKAKPHELVYHLSEGKTSLDEVASVIVLPKFDAQAEAREAQQTDEIPDIVREQIRSLVERIAVMYHDQPFHNFEHACHVTSAVDKFMGRITTPDIEEESSTGKKDMASQLHEYTHGIISDPITLLAIVFSALCHDVDHRGVSNVQLAKEETAMAAVYRGQSIAEQNSVDLAWNVFMEDGYEALRAALFVNGAEMMRFRQIFVQVVLATDIFDKELNTLRKERWNLAFGNDGSVRNDLRATIVIEHIIQASDVAHTMQHWHVYRKWNRRLFEEMYLAYKQGRMAKDPSTFWYEGEIGFFDAYVIPLAKKLKDCNVFGVSSDECLNYCLSNRAEWIERGREIVAEAVEHLAAGDASQC